MIDLSGHLALVTGSTQGVGAAVAESLCRSGCEVILHGLREDEAAKATLQRCRQFQPGTSLVCCDLDDGLDAIVKSLFHDRMQSGRVPDLLVNNAGVFIDQPYLEMDPRTLDRTFHINVRVPYFLTQAYARYWVACGTAARVLMTGSINGLLAEPTHTAYDASKAALAGLVRSLCVALAPHRIRVNAIAPGLVRTPLTNQVLNHDIAMRRWMEWHTPNGSVPSAEVCGPMAAFLLSDLAEHIHGQTIYIDGGMSCWQQPDPPDSLRSWMEANP